MFRTCLHFYEKIIENIPAFMTSIADVIYAVIGEHANYYSYNSLEQLEHVMSHGSTHRLS